VNIDVLYVKDSDITSQEVELDRHTWKELEDWKLKHHLFLKWNERMDQLEYILQDDVWYSIHIPYEVRPGSDCKKKTVKLASPTSWRSPRQHIVDNPLLLKLLAKMDFEPVESQANEEH
jgi:hypothetical protein